VEVAGTPKGGSPNGITDTGYFVRIVIALVVGLTGLAMVGWFGVVWFLGLMFVAGVYALRGYYERKIPSVVPIGIGILTGILLLWMAAVAVS
jgi:hypothetical protein